MAWRDWAKSRSEPALQSAVRPASAASTSAAHHANPRNAEASGEGRIAVPGRAELTTAPVPSFHIAKRCSITLKRPKTGTIRALCQRTDSLHRLETFLCWDLLQPGTDPG